MNFDLLFVCIIVLLVIIILALAVFLSVVLSELGKLADRLAFISKNETNMQLGMSVILGTGTNFRTCRKFAPCQYNRIYGRASICKAFRPMVLCKWHMANTVNGKNMPVNSIICGSLNALSGRSTK